MAKPLNPRIRVRQILYIVILCVGGFPTCFAQSSLRELGFQYEEVMIRMRDGVQLQTVVISPQGQHASLPILLRRTPYGVPTGPQWKMPPYMVELAKDGYIFVVQNIRGRFKSEGVFKLSSEADIADLTQVNEVTDAYDTIAWLVANVSHCNGKVGMIGVSYDGLTAALTLLHPHPALAAVSEQASPVDEWMNDDHHRYGALRESYAFEYSFYEQADKNKNSHFPFGVYDTYDWYLQAGPISNINAEFAHGALPFWNSIVDHPNYDEFWKKEAWVSRLRTSRVPVLNVAGFWDQEDPWGPWKIFQAMAAVGSSDDNFMVVGPWYHGQWHRDPGDHIGLITFAGHDTSREFRENFEAPFFRYYLHGEGRKPQGSVFAFQVGSNTWHTYRSWPPKEVHETKLYLHSNGTLSFDPAGKHDEDRREFISDPANPVPYRQRPISPIYPAADWRIWEVSDQRFVDHRPDVLTYVSARLDQDLTMTGVVSAFIYFSTSGSDSDLVVKLIDVYPETAESNRWDAETGPAAGQYVNSLNGYECPVAMEVRRGRYLRSYQYPEPLEPNKPLLWTVPLGDRDYVFRTGHRIMLQIQSSWFPLIDRNPQKFVPNINKAQVRDFIKATQSVYSDRGHSSYVLLPVIPMADDSPRNQ
jgi:uncharacterized protein